MLIAAALSAGLASPLAAQLTGDTLIRGLNNPVAIVADPTDRALLLIAEQGGLLRVARAGALLDEPLLDLRQEISSGGERGFLGLAIAPDTFASRWIFVNFTNRSGHTVIARFTLRTDPTLTIDLT
jgi:glucose/arabinose dehydrogenase